LEENKTAKFFVITDHGHHSLPPCTEIRNAIKIWRIKNLTFPFLCSKERNNERGENKEKLSRGKFLSPSCLPHTTVLPLIFRLIPPHAKTSSSTLSPDE
jgi:hypothetical protein